MQSLTHHLIFFLIFLLLSGSLKSPAAAEAPSAANDNAHKLLQQFGFPRGLLPGNVVNYTVTADGEFSVELSSSCYIQFSDLAYYHRTIRGKISRNLISGISGIQAKKFFFWVAISTISSDQEHSTIQFSNGAITANAPAAEFADVRSCQKWISFSPFSPGATV